MIARTKALMKRHWPRLRLRTILFATLFLVAALPGIGAVFLRVYENTLVRQTEAELVAQGAALAATAAAVWPGAGPLATPAADDLRPEPPRIDLSANAVLPERPAPTVTGKPPAADAAAALVTLAPILLQTRRTTLAGIVLLDGAGRVAGGRDAGASYAALPEVRAALAGRADTVIRRNAGYRAVYRFEWLSRAAAIRVHHARPIVVGGRVVGVLLLTRSARALFRGLYEDRGKIAVGILVIFGMLIVLSGLLSRGITRPIEALGMATRSVAAGRGSVPDPPQTAAIEIQGLYVDFAAMAEAIDRRSRYLRDFAHAVSHEFKTPLAGIRGAIELLRDHAETMAPEDRARFLANADADAQRLAMLVTRLLELARADMTRSNVAAAIDLAITVATIADALRSETLAIIVQLPTNLPPVAVPATTLDATLTALIENAAQAGASIVTLSAKGSAEVVILQIANDGPAIDAADRTRIFEPFFTTRRAAGGSGLGLSIIRSLLHAAGAAIDLADDEPGTSFVLTLPRA